VHRRNHQSPSASEWQRNNADCAPVKCDCGYTTYVPPETTATIFGACRTGVAAPARHLMHPAGMAALVVGALALLAVLS